MELDLMESVRSRLEAAGIGNIYARLADAARHDEFTVLSFAAPMRPECFFDMSMDIAARVTVVCLRHSDFEAMADATAAFDALMADPPESANGSYRLTGMDISLPSPVTWDESGRLAWAFDMNLTIKRKDA